MTDEYRDLLQEVIVKNRTLPPGCDRWGIKSVSAGLTTHNGFSWLPAVHNGYLEASDPDPVNLGPCPGYMGDGLCVAWTWRGMASGGIPANTLLLLAYRSQDVLGFDNEDGKARVTRVEFVDVIDGAELIRNHGAGADLEFANLQGMDLSCGELRGADLSRVNADHARFHGATLHEANLSCGELRGANLSRASADYANFCGASLYEANLSYGELRGADLSRVYADHARFHGATLYEANLSQGFFAGCEFSSAYMERANLFKANLARTRFHSAYISGANFDDTRLRMADFRNVKGVREARWGWDHWRDMDTVLGLDDLIAEHNRKENQ